MIHKIHVDHLHFASSCCLCLNASRAGGLARVKAGCLLSLLGALQPHVTIQTPELVLNIAIAQFLDHASG